jgi:hypothetical protein
MTFSAPLTGARRRCETRRRRPPLGYVPRPTRTLARSCRPNSMWSRHSSNCSTDRRTTRNRCVRPRGPGNRRGSPSPDTSSRRRSPNRRSPLFSCRRSPCPPRSARRPCPSGRQSPRPAGQRRTAATSFVEATGQAGARTQGQQGTRSGAGARDHRDRRPSDVHAALGDGLVPAARGAVGVQRPTPNARRCSARSASSSRAWPDSACTCGARPRPFPADLWAAQLDQHTPRPLPPVPNAPSWGDHLVAAQRHLRRSTTPRVRLSSASPSPDARLGDSMAERLLKAFGKGTPESERKKLGRQVEQFDEVLAAFGYARATSRGIRAGVVALPVGRARHGASRVHRHGRPRQLGCRRPAGAHRAASSATARLTAARSSWSTA